MSVLLPNIIGIGKISSGYRWRALKNLHQCNSQRVMYRNVRNSLFSSSANTFRNVRQNLYSQVNCEQQQRWSTSSAGQKAKPGPSRLKLSGSAIIVGVTVGSGK